MTLPRRGPAVALALAFAAAGCGPSAERREGQAVLAAIDAVRGAPAEPRAHRQELRAALGALAASDPRAAAARDACHRAYGHHMLALELGARAEALGAGLPADGGAPEDPVELLGRAEAEIQKARQTMPECEAAAADLRRSLQ